MAGAGDVALAVEALPASIGPWWDGRAGDQAASGQGRCEWGDPITPLVTPQIGPIHWPGLGTLPLHEIHAPDLY